MWWNSRSRNRKSHRSDPRWPGSLFLPWFQSKKATPGPLSGLSLKAAWTGTGRGSNITRGRWAQHQCSDILGLAGRSLCLGGQIVSRGQGRCWISHNAQDNSPQPRLIQPKMWRLTNPALDTEVILKQINHVALKIYKFSCILKRITWHAC